MVMFGGLDPQCLDGVGQPTTSKGTQKTGCPATLTGFGVVASQGGTVAPDKICCRHAEDRAGKDPNSACQIQRLGNALRTNESIRCASAH
jgi:hypothetical protein